MSGNTDWGRQWNGQQNTVSKQQQTVNGQSYNWGGHRQSNVAWGGQFNGQQAVGSYNGQMTQSNYSYNGQSASNGYSYNGHSSVSAYSSTGQVLPHPSPNVHGWSSSNHLTGQSTSYSGYGQAAPPGHMRQPPPYGGHKKVRVVVFVVVMVGNIGSCRRWTGMSRWTRSSWRSWARWWMAEGDGWRWVMKIFNCHFVK